VTRDRPTPLEPDLGAAVTIICGVGLGMVGTGTLLGVLTTGGGLGDFGDVEGALGLGALGLGALGLVGRLGKACFCKQYILEYHTH
jgi:hypothetical protein